MSDKQMSDVEHLNVLGYDDSFSRSMKLWDNFALGFTYLSPLVGVYSLFALAVSVGGPPSIWWLVIVGVGQLLVAMIFGETVSQFPLHGGIYSWARRLWGVRWAWMAAWVYMAAIIVTITSVAEYGSGFAAALFGITPDAKSGFLLTAAIVLIGLLINFSGTKWLGRVARIGFAAELLGVLGIGLYLLIFQRHNDFSVLFDTLGAGGEGGYMTAFLGSALAGLFLYFGFEACGNVAEEVENPARRIPKAMLLTIVVGGISALFSFAGYILAAPDLPAIMSGDDADPIPSILQASLGDVGAKIFLVVAVTAFISCVLSLQANSSRLLYSFGRDQMIPGHTWLSKVTKNSKIPGNALVLTSILTLLIAGLVWYDAALLVQVTAFAVSGIYVSFQMVVLAALRMRTKGWKPAGPFSLGRWGGLVNVLALAYGLFALWLLLTPGSSGDFLTDWIAGIGLAVVLGSGLLYLFIARPDRKSDAPAGDAIEVANKLRAHSAS